MPDFNGDISWGADTDISMPEPLSSKQQVWVDMGGFCFTLQGIAHNFTESDREVYLNPTFAPDPYGLAGEVP